MTIAEETNRRRNNVARKVNLEMNVDPVSAACEGRKAKETRRTNTAKKKEVQHRWS